MIAYAYTKGCFHPILAGCDDSSIVIECNQEALTLLEEERQRDLPSNLQLAAAELCDSVWWQQDGVQLIVFPDANKDIYQWR